MDKDKKETYQTMLKELDDEKAEISATINYSKSIVQEHEVIIKESQRKLDELDMGIQFLKKRFLREEAEPVLISTHEDISVTDPSPVVDMALDEAIMKILDNELERKFKPREVTEILESQKFPTRSNSFIDVVSNTLRTLARNKKIGFEKTGKFVKYFSLTNQQKSDEPIKFTTRFPKLPDMQRREPVVRDTQN